MEKNVTPNPNVKNDTNLGKLFMVQRIFRFEIQAACSIFKNFCNIQILSCIIIVLKVCLRV